MDFSPRGGRPAPQDRPAAPTVSTTSAPTSNKASSSSIRSHILSFDRIASLVMLMSLTVLAVGVIGLLVFGTGGKSSNEAANVKTEQYQAVFLNGGQVYFGKIVRFNGNFVALKDIYYLRVDQQVQPGQSQTASNNVNLAKLGNELYGPEDIMFINRDQVQFWENLKDDGQVVKAIKEHIANPDAANQQNSTTPTTDNTTNTNTTPTTPTTNNTTNPTTTPTTPTQRR